jgi:hypothetical protein
MPSLDIDQHVGIHEIHRLCPHPSLGLFSQGTRVRCGIRDVRPRSNKPFNSPVCEKFRPISRGRLRSPIIVQDSQDVLRQGKSEFGGFGGECSFQVSWQFQH